MALVKTKGLGKVVTFVAAVARRARRLPRRYSISTSDTVANVQHRGGRQRVTRPMQLAIRAKVGPGARIPKVNATLVHPRRPVHATLKMSARAVAALGKHVLFGGPTGVEPTLRRSISAQFAAGGTPSWPASRSWGRLTARRPTLGGAAGRVAKAWQQGPYREGR